MTKDESPGLWESSAAGHVESGENYHKCAKREVDEELNISDVKLIEVMSIPAQIKTFWEHIRVYKCITDKKICINKTEISEGRYFGLFEIKGLMLNNPDMFTPTFSNIYENYIIKNM